MTMTTSDIVPRVGGLEVLSMGLAQEIVAVRKANDPLLRAERQAYVAGLHDALAGVEAARVVLAKASTRLLGMGTHWLT
jgi:hypothetical protein